MNERISLETFMRLVKLAELEMDAAEAEYLRGELNKQLDAIHQLEAIPLDENLPLSLHGVSYPAQNSQVLRPDTWQPFEDVELLLEQVPELNDGYITVPDIPAKTLE